METTENMLSVTVSNLKKKKNEAKYRERRGKVWEEFNHLVVGRGSWGTGHKRKIFTYIFISLNLKKPRLLP